jgi:hypothetical protein
MGDQGSGPRGSGERWASPTGAAPVFDVAAGGDVATLNATIAAFYGTCGSVFKQKFTFSEGWAEVDFQVTPTVTLEPTEIVLAHAREFAEANVEAAAEQAIVELTASALTATCSSVRCEFEIEGNKETVTASVTCSASVEIEPNPGEANYLFHLVLANPVITVPNDPGLSKLLTNVVGPLLVKYLNEHVLDHIKIPTISLLGVDFAMPVISEESAGGDEFLLGYTGLNPVIPPAPGTSWPGGTLFAAVDASVLNAVALKELPAPHGQGGIDDPVNLSWEYEVGFSPSFELEPGAGDEISATLGIGGSASITWHTPNGLPNITFGGSFSGSVQVTVGLEARQSGANEEIFLVIEGISNLDVSISIHGLPGILEELLSEIIDAILKPIVAAISAALSGYAIHVTTLKPIPLSFADLPAYQLVVENLQLSQIAGPGGVPLATVTALAAFQQVPTPSVSTSYSWSRRPSIPAAT